ncbi:Uncharacterized beta-barrel protein YwiB, DUF1934 family [Eubacterium uniforme]|uniref:Uncharacterized beta-barrel protein YwiB, DUF1934 family n=1 Tax=Eubacterium uniforme TaxID=39495 RepID=A0A1T4VH71_9FIRM|nr:DUF1934 domain-containing protein [Eubacterium uniforme]SKA64286.1 Uncharacterized beta-barrel protein YwiB, DUF1934 family [Eubacterium uniforme]
MINMNEKIKVQITTIHKTDEGEFPMSVIADGNYKKINDTHYVNYEYKDEESGAITKALIKAGGDRVEVINNGDFKYKMAFAKNEVRDLDTDVGGLVLSLKQVTKEVYITEDGDDLLIEMEYELYQGDELTSSCDMKINILRRIQ